MQPKDIHNEVIRGRADVGLLRKADRLFRNDGAGTFVEVLQNARRAGAKSIAVTIEECRDAVGYCIVAVQDDGEGIQNFQSLVTLGESGWSAETQQVEDPAGMGFYSLCLSGVEVFSRGFYANITPDVFLGKADAEVQQDEECFQGTRLRFTRQSSKEALTAALKRVAKFYPLDVRLNGEALPRYDFLEGAIHREVIDGIEVGFATKFAHNWDPYKDDNWNFYGALIHEPALSFIGMLIDGRKDCLYARFNVIESGRVKLQLPDRRSVIQDDFLKQFEKKARAAAYRCFAMQPQHALPYKDWLEAKELGVPLPEAASLLTSWSASACDPTIEPLFGHEAAAIVRDLTRATLIERDVQHPHTLQGALHSGATLDADLYHERREYRGYFWYDALPRVTQAEVIIDGCSAEDSDLLGGQARASTIDVFVIVRQRGKAEREIRLPAYIHVDSESYNALQFVAVKDSPWDNDELSGPFPLDDFLMWATFCASDDCESDSWETQSYCYEQEIARQLNRYFRGPRATLLALLGRALSFDASALAESLNLSEIRFTRPLPGSHRWGIELIESSRHASGSDDVPTLHG
jgi:hypothetical protein